MRELLKDFIQTPPLWKNQQFGLQQFVFPAVDLNSIKSVKLPTNLRLGYQLEYVFKQLITASKSHELILSNLLIEEGKTRIGELDFILRERNTNQYSHVELTYKFYIINPEISEPIYRLMGPNRRDMFFTKLDKLKEKQFPQLYHKSLLPLWEANGVDLKEIQQECCFKAQLFEPYEEKVSIRPLNGNCISGKWIRFDQFNSSEFAKAHFYVPRKLEWALTPHLKVNWANHFETLLEVNLSMVKENAPMLWARWPSGRIEKIFVVWW